MPSGGAPIRHVRFGAYSFDQEQHRLFEADVELALNPKALAVLAYLVERPGHIASKEELLNAVWNSTAVTDDALVQRVLDIRKALKDDSKNPHFIRTHPKRGYEWIGGSGDERASHAPATETPCLKGELHPFLPPVSRRLPPWLKEALVFLGLQALVATLLWTRSPNRIPPPYSQLIRLTASPGMEDHPAPEPAGPGRVLFTANDGNTLRLWLLDPHTGKQEPFGLPGVQQSEGDWSADGRQIAFRSDSPQAGLFIQPVGGAPSRFSTFGHHPRWSPDGTRIVFQTEGPSGKLLVHNISTGHSEPVRLEGTSLSNVSCPVWSPDGKWLYFLAIAVPGATIPGQVVLGHQVWRVSAQGGQPSLVTPRIGVVRDGGFDLRRDGLEIVFVGLDRSLWTLPIDKETGLGSGKARHLTISTEEHKHPRYRAQGGIVFSTVASPDSLWLIPFAKAQQDPSARRRLTRDGMLARQPAVAPDGRRIAFITWVGDRFEIWALDMETLRSWRLSPAGGPSRVRPAWSHDGQSMVYSVLDGTYRTYRAAWLDAAGQSVVREMTIPEPSFPLENGGFTVSESGRLEPYGRPQPSRELRGALLAGLEPRFPQSIAGRPEVYFMAASNGWYNLWRISPAPSARPERITSFDGGRFHLSDSNGDFSLHPKGIIVSVRENRSDLWMIR